MKKVWLPCAALILLAATASTQSASPSTDEPVAKAKGLQKELGLTDQQTEKIAAIYEESSQQLQTIMKKAGGENANKQSLAAERRTTNKKIKAVLTPKQAVRFAALEK